MAPPLLPIYLLAGTDRPKVRRAVGRLRGRIEAEGGQVELLDAERTGPADAVAACNALGLFGGPRLVLVDGIEPADADAAWASGGIAPLEAYLASPAPDATLALIAGPRLRKDHRLLKALPKECLLHFDLPDEKELPAHIRREAARVGLDLTATAMRRLVGVLARRPHAIDAELEKLAAYAGGEQVDEDAIELLVESAPDSVPWAFLDAVTARDRGRAFALLERLRQGGATAPSLVALLGNQVQALAVARRCLDAGVPRAEAVTRIGGHPFRAGKVLDGARGWSAEAAGAAVIGIAALDHAVKGGTRLDPELSFDRTLAAIL